MTDYAYFDLCFFERCNLTCKYCRQSNKEMMPPSSYQAVQAVVDQFLLHSTAAIFKISGYGEASLWPGYLNLLGHYAEKFPSVQLMTNGTLSRNDIASLCRLPNLSFCTTIDSYELSGNACRVHGQLRLHQRMLGFLTHVVDFHKKTTEVNCVVTRHNISKIFKLGRWLSSRYGNSVRLLPFPVRPFHGLDRIDLFPFPEQIDALRSTLERNNYSTTDSALPPRSYMNRLLEFLSIKRRGHACYISQANYGVGPRLTPLKCACAGHTTPSQDQSNIRKGRTATSIQGYVDARCHDCFNHYEVVNLFIEEELTEFELQLFPAFNMIGVKETLVKIRDQLNKKILKRRRKE